MSVNYGCWDTQTIKLFAQKRLCTGRGKEYNPALTVENGPSNMHRMRYRLHHTGTYLHLFGHRQFYIAYQLDYRKDVVDVLHNVAIPRDQMLRICRKLNIEPPRWNNEIAIIYIDFIAYTTSGTEAWILLGDVAEDEHPLPPDNFDLPVSRDSDSAMEPPSPPNPSDSDTPHHMSRKDAIFAIQKKYCELNNYTVHPVEKNCIHPVRFWNLAVIMAPNLLDEESIGQEPYEEFITQFRSTESSISEIAQQIQRKFHLPAGYGSCIFLKLAREQALSIDLDVPLNRLTDRPFPEHDLQWILDSRVSQEIPAALISDAPLVIPPQIWYDSRIIPKKTEASSTPSLIHLLDLDVQVPASCCLRVIFTDPPDQKDRMIYYIPLVPDVEWIAPKSMNYSDFTALIHLNHLHLCRDAYHLWLPHGIITDPMRNAMNKWSHIFSDLPVKGQLIWDHKYRNKVIHALSDIHSIRPDSIRKQLFSYWRAGFDELAFCPDNHQKGRKKAQPQSVVSIAKKVKTDTALQNISVHNTDQIVPISATESSTTTPSASEYAHPMTTEVIQLCKSITEHFYLSTKEIPRSMAFRRLETAVHAENAKRTVYGLPRLPIPTYPQYNYWLKANYTQETLLRRRKSTRDYNLTNRPVLGTVLMGPIGPGWFETDGTKDDYYCVSSFDRATPLLPLQLYIIFDRFSGAVATFYVGMHQESIETLRSALLLLASDMVADAKSHGIEDVQPEDFPFMGLLPSTVISDNSFMKEKDAGQVFRNLGINVQNVPHYRGDLKPFVENFHKTLQSYLRLLSGKSKKHSEQYKPKDPAKEAVLSFEEHLKIIIMAIIMHNRSAIPSQVRPSYEMIPLNVPRTPSAIARWGIENLSGALRPVSRSRMRDAFLLHGEAHESKYGLQFKNLYYTNPIAEKNGWFISSREFRRSGFRKLSVRYDPWRCDEIYVMDPDSGTELTFYPTPKFEPFKELSFTETVYYLDQVQKKRADSLDARSEKRRIFEEEVIKIETEAKALTDAARKKAGGVKKKHTVKASEDQKSLEKYWLKKIDGDIISESHSQEQSASSDPNKPDNTLPGQCQQPSNGDISTISDLYRQQISLLEAKKAGGNELTDQEKSDLRLLILKESHQRGLEAAEKVLNTPDVILNGKS